MILSFIFNAFIVALVVMLHYELLYQMTLFIPKCRLPDRFRIVLGVFGTMIAHVIEVWVFALAYYWMHNDTNWGKIEGNYNGSLIDSVYFSLTTFTTLGFGDIEPHGELRFLVGIEAVTGLVLITWSASFLYLEMQRFWKDN